MRYFLSRVAHASRRAELEVHAFVLLTNHFHLLVRSPEGRMAEAMRRIQNEYVRWFNRRNRRDGPLFRGRFLSRRVRSLRYRRILVSYIDRNPVAARISMTSEAYEYGSARHYAKRAGPRWLVRTWVERDCTEQSGSATFTWAAYERVYSALGEEACALAEQRLRRPPHDVDPLDELVHATPPSVLSWMRRKAALADGTRPGLACVPAVSVSTECRRRAELSSWVARIGRRNDVCLWGVLEVGLLRDLSGLRWQEIAQRLAVSPASANRRYRIHRREVAVDGVYARRVQELATRLLTALG